MKSIDPDVFELAKKHIVDSTIECSLENITDLAGCLQDKIEDWFDDHPTETIEVRRENAKADQAHARDKDDYSDLPW